MGRKKGIPTCVIPIRVKLDIKKKVVSYANETGLTIQEAYKQMIKRGKF